MLLLLQQLSAFFVKELQLLRRDRGALLILFFMPVALVIIVCLVQDNIIKVTGNSSVKLLVVDHDHGYLGQQLAQQLADSDSFQVTYAGDEVDLEQAKSDVNSGKWQVGVYFPDHISRQLQQRAITMVRSGLVGNKNAAENDPLSQMTVDYFFDPAVQGGFQAGISGMLRQLVAKSVLIKQMDALQHVLPAYIEKQVTATLGPMYAQVLGREQLHLAMPELTQPIVAAVQVSVANVEGGAEFVQPTSVQHNVPAWSLFGIFFIMLPLSGVILQERSHGVFPRLFIVPGSKLGLLLGRLLAYQLVCFVQFCLMLAVGYFVLPRLGTDLLQFNGQLGALFIVALSAGLTACGFGLLLGALARSEQQAIMIAAVSIVISAALGGIMVPVYMMPAVMQKLSIVSPLGWGLEASQSLLLRGGSLFDIVPQLLAMLGCFFCCLFMSWRKTVKL